MLFNTGAPLSTWINFNRRMEKVIVTIVTQCEIEVLFLSQTSKAAPLKFGIG